MAIKEFKTNQTLIDDAFNQQSGGTLILSGNTILADSGTFQYLNDKSSTYVARSVVDAEYVTGLTSAITTIGSVNQVIYRGISGITGATDFTYSQATSEVTIPNLCISQTPETDVGDYFLLTWDSGTTKVNKVSAISVTGLQSASNGLSVDGSDAVLGGTLICDTKICGDTFDFCINNESANIVIDNQNNGGGIYLKSQSGSEPYFNTFTGAVGFGIDYNAGFKVYDNRVGASQVGIEYASNYATYYTARSLVDKNYVDTIAAGLKPLPAVLAATTGNTILSGITGVTIIDGVEINVPISLTDNRVLIKDQTNAKYNGIYVLTGGTTGGTGTTFVRSYDFDESTESVQGAYTFVISGDSNKSTSWVLSTPNPILIDTTPLLFTLFNQLTTIIAGHGIDISINYGEHTISVDGATLAGNSLSWDGTYFNVDISGGTLGTALSQIEDDITGNTAAINVNSLNISNLGAISGITNASITGVTNGLTKVGSHNARLGGTLSEITTITATGTTSLTFIDSRTTPIGIEYGDDYSTGFTDNSLVTKLYVDSGITGSSNTVGVCNVYVNYTATTSSDFIGVSGATEIWLPAVPKACQRITVVDICGNALSAGIIVWGNGKCIIGNSYSTINTDYGSTTFVNNGYFWSAVAFIN